MFRKWLVRIMSFIMYICSVLGIPFGQQPAPPEMISYDDTKTTAIISLESNPTAGYDWTYEISDQKVITIIGDKYIKGNSSNTVGSSGTRQVSFRGLAAGSAIITFNYLRSWEGEPVRTVVIKITVTSDKTLTAKEIDNNVGLNSSDINEVVDYYNAAYAATNDPPKGKKP